MAALALAACSSKSSSTPPGGSNAPPGDDTWTDGKHVNADLTIPFGSTVTVAPGARVTFDAGVAVTVQGTLKAASRQTHATLGGTSWSGLVIPTGGVADLDGVDIANADTALSVQGGTASYQYGTISASGAFDIGLGGKVDVHHSTVKGALRPSAIIGSFTATFLDYDAAAFEGIVAQDNGATISIEDSHIHGTASQDNDLVAARGGASVHVAYTELSQAHCGFHFEPVTVFDVSHVSIHDGWYGMMLYGSATDGTRTVTASNIFNNKSRGAEEDTQNTVNGPITISDGYWANNGSTPDDNLRQFTGKITVTNMSTTTPVPDVGPRAPVP